MRTKLTNRETGHAWYYNTDETQRIGAKSFFFEGGIIYSYGYHFPIAVKHTDKNVVLFTTRGYSNTTAKHISIVRSAIPATCRVINVDNPTALTAYKHQQNYNERLEHINHLVDQISTGRDGTYAQDARVNELFRTVNQLNLYNTAFNIGQPVLLDRDFLSPERLAAHREMILARRKDDREQRIREQAVIEIQNQEKIKAWQSGGINSLPWGIDKVYLRLSADGSKVETSKGAEIELSHAKLLFAYVKAVMGGRAFAQKHFGSFTLTDVKKNGDITIGCHRITFEEMERLHGQLEG